MKSSFKLIIACLAAGVLLASCAKENLASDRSEAVKGNVVTLTVKADLPEPETTPGSKLTLDNTTMKMAWDGEEKLLVYAGKVGRNKADDADSVVTYKTFTLTGGTGDNKGVFSGELDFGDTGLTVDDIKGVALNTNITNSINRLECSGDKLYMRLAGTQSVTQNQNDVFNGIQGTPFAIVSPANIQNNGGEYTISGISLSYAHPVLKFYVYDSSGEHAGNTLKTIRISGGTVYGGTAICVSDGTITNIGQQYTYTEVKFTGDDAISTSKDNAIKVYLPIYKPRTLTFNTIKVTVNDGTDNIDITKTFNSALTNFVLNAGKIYTIGLDIANGASMLEYSSNGGSSWSTKLPETSFSTLAIRQKSTAPATFSISASALSGVFTNVKTAITNNGDAEGVDLDISGINVASGIVPAGLSGVAIKSIKLPANTTELDANCFKNCSKLESVDLTGIPGLVIGDYAFYGCTALTSFDFSNVKTIGSYSFYNVPITEVDLSSAQPGTLVKTLAFVNETTRTISSTNSTLVPNPASNTSIKTVKLNNNVELEIYAFMRLTALEYVYYDVPDCTKNAFGWQTGNWVTSYEHHNDLTAVIGPHVTATNMTFWTNANLSKVIIEDGANGFGGNTFACCRYLKEIECRATTEAPSIATSTFRYYEGSSASRSTGYSVAAAEKKLLVPAASAGFYDETNGGLWYTTVQQNLGYTLTTY